MHAFLRTVAPCLRPSALYIQLSTLPFENEDAESVSSSPPLVDPNMTVFTDALHSIADVERMLDAIHFWLLSFDYMPPTLIEYVLEHKEEIETWVNEVGKQDPRFAPVADFVRCMRWISETQKAMFPCVDAAEKGYLACLRYAHEHGEPCGEWTCTWAAYYGHLDCLAYAHEHGAPWDDTCTEAFESGHVDCLRYAHEHGAPLPNYFTLSQGMLDCYTYVLNNQTNPRCNKK